jgi:hypothetical protein
VVDAVAGGDHVLDGDGRVGGCFGGAVLEDAGGVAGDELDACGCLAGAGAGGEGVGGVGVGVGEDALGVLLGGGASAVVGGDRCGVGVDRLLGRGAFVFD